MLNLPAEVDLHEQHGIAVIPKGSEYYPNHLADIMSAPAVLYARGNLELLKQPAGISIVGSRDATRAGLEIARRMAHYVASRGHVVVSGLALGIDAAAHKGCLEAGGKTIAVLAHGLHAATPKKNAGLANDILDSGGLWVSEHPVNTKAQRHYFVARNRIQVGLSQSSVIVESDIKSGTMTHAEFCLKEKHKLFAVMPQTEENPLRLKCSGPEFLVAQKNAISIKSKEDYLLLDLDS